MTPLVSIGIPIYNTATYVQHTLDSIKKQTYSNIEIIVVDDGSTDDSGKQVENWSKENNVSIKLITNKENVGLTQTCKIILDNAKGKYLQKVDADDILLDTKIEKHVQLLEMLGEQTALVYSKVKLIDENGNLLEQDYFDRLGYDEKKSGDTYFDLLNINFIPNPSVLSRTAAIKEVGGYDTNLLFEDWDLWLRLARKYKFYYDNTVTCYYRIHKHSMMSDNTKVVIRNNTNIVMYKKNMGINEEYNTLTMAKLKSLVIYSYFKNDPESNKKLKWYLKNKFDFKVLIYFILASFGIKHPSNILRKATLSSSKD